MSTGGLNVSKDIKAAQANVHQSDNASVGEDAQASISKLLAESLLDFTLILGLIFGGCCSNVWSYEYILKMDSHLGTALTFSQMCFITLHSLPSFLQWDQGSLIPSLQRRHVPIRQWVVQVFVLTSSSLLNNWAFAFHVPLTVQIVFRSAGKFGLAVSMLFGFLFFKRRYSLPQITAVAVVTVGGLLATLSRPSPSGSTTAINDPKASLKYTLGVMMMSTSLLLTGVLGMLQERTYSVYGPYWREGVFYTHLLSLPIFVFLASEVKTGFESLSAQTAIYGASTGSPFPKFITHFTPYIILALNLVTQLMCVSAVNRLTSRVTSVSTNLVLTTRKAISLCISVWWFGNGWNTGLTMGAGMVFAGSLLYTFVSSGSSARSNAQSTPDGMPQTKGEKTKKE